MSLDQWIVKTIQHNPNKKFWWDETNGYYLVECGEWDRVIYPAKCNGFDVKQVGNCLEYTDNQNVRHILLQMIANHRWW